MPKAWRIKQKAEMNAYRESFAAVFYKFLSAAAFCRLAYFAAHFVIRYKLDKPLIFSIALGFMLSGLCCFISFFFGQPLSKENNSRIDSLTVESRFYHKQRYAALSQCSFLYR